MCTDSPFPDGNPDSLSPSSSAYATYGGTPSAGAEPPSGAEPQRQQQETVFVIDESMPRQHNRKREEEEEEQGEEDASPHPPRPPSPSRITSITEEEALGEENPPIFL